MDPKFAQHLEDIKSTSCFLAADLLDLVADNARNFRKQTRKVADKLRQTGFNGG